jgi:ubiquinone/menaquinone biosynthesis C-methylase UbiE
VACGAGFLACAFAPSARWVYGIDLSRRMVHEALILARTRGRHNTAFYQVDAEALPFGPDVYDLITSKLAFHYFPHPRLAIAEMVRVAIPQARVVLIDHVSLEDPGQRAYQNRLDKLLSGLAASGAWAQAGTHMRPHRMSSSGPISPRYRLERSWRSLKAR